LTGVALAVEVITGTFRAGRSRWMRQWEAWTLAGIAHDATTLIGMLQKGELR